MRTPIAPEEQPHALAYDPDWTVLRGLESADKLNPAPGAGYTFVDGKGQAEKLTFPELRAEAARLGAHLLSRGLEKGDRLALILPDPKGFVLSFLAATSVGIVPVPLYPPLGFGTLDAYMARTARILAKAGTRMLLTTRQVQPVLWQLTGTVGCLEDLLCLEKLEGPGPTDAPTPAALHPDDPAFLQFTSGSTAEPKGVVVTHRSLGANGFAIMRHGVDVDVAVDVALSWLPLYHDMGLIGFVVSPLCAGLQSVFLPTTSFMKHPTRWMEAMHHYKGTITFAPNFAYGLATRRTRPETVATLDLSHVRLLGAGAEPNHPGTLEAFLDHFAAAGLQRTAILPVYGMAEATLAVTFCRLDSELRVDRVDADQYQARAQAIVSDSEDALSFVSCGHVWPGHSITIVDDAGEPLPDRTVGEIVFSGPSVAAGYYEAPEETAATFTSRGLHTGDLGYLDHGELFVTGRKKDLIILNGRNYDPQSIEWICAELDGVRRGNVVAFSVPGTTSEELVIVCEVTPGSDHVATDSTIRQHIHSELYLTIKDVQLCPRGTLPKTTSGKLQRSKTREQYLAGVLASEGVRTLGEKGKNLTLAKHVARSMVSRVRHRVRRATQRTP